MGRVRRHPPPAASFSDSEPEEISADSSDRDPDEISVDHIDMLEMIDHDHDNDNDNDEVIHVEVDDPLPKTRAELKAYVDCLRKAEIGVKEEKGVERGIRTFFIVSLTFKILYTIWTLSHASSSSSLSTWGFIYMFLVMVCMWLSTGVDWAIVTIFKENRHEQLLVLSRSGLIQCDKRLRRLIVAKMLIIFMILVFLIRGIQGGSAPTPFEFTFPLYLYVFVYGGLSFLIGLVWLQYQMRSPTAEAAPEANDAIKGQVPN